jgi:hypothetical protein
LQAEQAQRVSLIGVENGRRTIVVHTKLAGHMARVEAARSGAHGVQVLTMGQMAARLAGGFIAPIDMGTLQDAVRDALPETDLGELENIKDLPGMVRAVVGTLEKVWQADIELSSQSHPRLKALARLEQNVLGRLPPYMQKPKDLVEIACKRIDYARTLLGPVAIRGHSEMPVCWRPLVEALSDFVAVLWIAGPRHVPDWVDGNRIEIQRTAPSGATLTVSSCATPQHEILEAFRWMRELLAAGTARPEEIGIASASPADFDDHVLALSEDANLPIHFVQGIKAVTTPEGQTAAALADVLIKGISQERVRRLLRRLSGTPGIADLPKGWTSVLPKEAPLTTTERWEHALGQVPKDKWPDGLDCSERLLEIVRLLAKGVDVAREAGDTLLPNLARRLWTRALQDGPPEVLPVTLARLRVDHEIEPASHPIWTSAISLAAAPRPFVRMVGLNSGRWPRGIYEDRLIPDLILPMEELDPLPIADADRRDFDTIIAAARQASASFSRRDVEGRQLGRSPLIGEGERIYLSRARMPTHAASESDRLLARPSEFQSTLIAQSGSACWRNRYRNEITSHDGLVRSGHPRLKKVFRQALSATSLGLLLRDPIRFAWHYGLGWREPQLADDPLTLDALDFGNLTHEVLQNAVTALEADGGFGKSSSDDIDRAVRDATATAASHWEASCPVPPRLIWQRTLQEIERLSAKALAYGFDPLPGQKSWTEVPFGATDAMARENLPWDVSRHVEIPNTGVVIRGRIDRLDVAGNNSRARVFDYKTGSLRTKMEDVVVDGGGELQRCLYALAVRTLIRDDIDVEASLLYLRAVDGQEGLFPLKDVDAALDLIAEAVSIARTNLEKGLALPGKDAAHTYNDFNFALPADPTYLDRKQPLAEERLGDATKIWEQP